MPGSLSFSGVAELRRTWLELDNQVDRELLLEAQRRNWLPGDYLNQRDRLRWERSLLRELSDWLEDRPTKLHFVPVTRPDLIRQAAELAKAQGAQPYLDVEAQYRDGSLQVHLKRLQPGPDFILYRSIQDDQRVVVLDPGPLLSAVPQSFLKPALGQISDFSLEVFEPLACRYDLDAPERRWLEMRLGRAISEDHFSLSVDFVPPSEYAERRSIAALFRQALESARIASREMEPGLLFAAIPGEMIEMVRHYHAVSEVGDGPDGPQYHRQKIQGRELLKSLAGCEPEPLLIPLVEWLAAAELGEPISLGMAQLYNEQGGVQVAAEVELRVEPEAAIFFESLLRDSEDVGEYLIAALAFPGSFASNAAARWPEMQVHAAEFENRSVWLFGLIDRYRIHDKLQKMLESRGWSSHRVIGEEWRDEWIEVWRQDAEAHDTGAISGTPRGEESLVEGLRGHIEPFAAYAEMLFHARSPEGALGARCRLLDAQFRQWLRQGSAPQGSG